MTTTQITPSVTNTTTTSTRRGLVLPGLAAAVAAGAATFVVAAAAKAVGVDFEMPDGGESIPLFGFANLAFIFSVVGLGLAAALRRWSRHPRTAFVRATVSLTAVSLVPPFLTDANAATVASLLLLHLTAAAIVIPVIARRLNA